jgi:signal transduction histidine kinase
MRSPSVRVRVAAAATVIVALAIGAASWALVRTVEHQLLDKVRTRGQQRVADVVRQLQSGVPPSMVSPSTAPAGGFVQVVNRAGAVLGGTGTVGAGGAGIANPILFVARLPDPGRSGGVQINVPDPGPGHASSTPIDVRYESIDTPQGRVTVVAGSSLDAVEGSISTLKNTLLFGVPVLVVLVAGIAWVMVGRALRPVEAIRAEVESISESTMHRRVPEPGTRDEVDRLAHTMNAMLDRLETSAVRQRRFVADASHELRSPIAGIRAQLEVGLQQKNDWPAIATTVLAEENRLETLVDDLLLLAAIDEHPLQPPAESTSVLEVARQHGARAHRVPVSLIEKHDVVLRMRQRLVDRVVGNLIDNGTRHARTTVVVTVSREGDRARLVVDDDGPGIPHEDRERVFERFARLDDGRARDRGGAGLGLALVKAIVESHQGTVTIDDAPIGGARIVVDLPTDNQKAVSLT